MDRGAWWAIVHRITKSQTRLKNLTQTKVIHRAELKNFEISTPSFADIYCPFGNISGFLNSLNKNLTPQHHYTTKATM